jgi:hypothetical protein
MHRFYKKNNLTDEYNFNKERQWLLRINNRTNSKLDTSIWNQSDQEF